jgi:zinc transport system substrate-binding protein
MSSPILNVEPGRLRAASWRAPRRAWLCGLVLAGLAGASPARSERPLVVATIKPLHSLVAGVMDGVGAPKLLLPAGSSPHTYALKPSDAKAIAAADLIVWIGPDLEMYLAKPLSDRAVKSKTLTLLREASIQRHARREGGIWADHESSAPAHGHGAYDPHLWLDPENGRRTATAVAARLATIDPDNASRYGANAARVRSEIDIVEAEIAAALAPLRRERYLVFHDGYQYFERRFGLSAAGAILIDPDRPPGAGRMNALRGRVASGDIRCVFAEPQFAAERVAALVQGTDAKVGTLDPYGTSVAEGPAGYPQMLRTLAASLRDCLAR